MRQSSASSYYLLVGAGVEVGYGMPTGAEFATGVFLSKATLKEQRAHLKSELDCIPPNGEWIPYRKWLGIDSTIRPRVTGVADRDFDTVIVDGLSARRESILNWLSDFDTHWHGVAAKALSEEDQELLGALSLPAPLKVRGVHDDRAISFFKSESFRRLVAVLKSDTFDHDSVRDPVFSLASVRIGVAAGALLQSHASQVSISPLENADDLPEGMDLAQCVPSLAIHGSSRLTITWTELRSTNPDLSGFAAAAVTLGNALLGLVVDYQQWIGALYHYLFRPYDSFAKFTKAVTFMRSAGNRIRSDFDTASTSDAIGYYEDIAEAEKSYRPGSIATTNYTSLVEWSGFSQRSVLYLNGHVEEQFDPYLQRHVQIDQDSSAPASITIPSLFVQSAVKPFTDIDLLHRYVTFHEKVRESGFLVVVGFGFNADDGHINALVRTVLFEGIRVLVFDYGDQGKTEYLHRLRLERAPSDVSERLVVKAIDSERNSEGLPWMEMVSRVMAQKQR